MTAKKLFLFPTGIVYYLCDVIAYEPRCIGVRLSEIRK